MNDTNVVLFFCFCDLLGFSGLSLILVVTEQFQAKICQREFGLFDTVGACLTGGGWEKGQVGLRFSVAGIGLLDSATRNSAIHQNR